MGSMNTDIEIEGLVFQSDSFAAAPSERAVSATLQEDDLALDRSLRPKHLDEYLGQTKVKDALWVLI